VSSTTRDTNASYTASNTMKRSAARQFCPAAMNTPVMAVCAACSTSASSHTMKGSLPPSSRITGVSDFALSAMIFFPFGTEPVKTILSTPPETSAAPVSA
jgi:hypothetical protein